MNSVGDIGGNIVVSQTVSWVAHYFSSSFQKLVGNEYCSKLEKKIQVTGHIHFEHILFFRVSPWIFEFKSILKLFPECIHTSGIFRTRDTSFFLINNQKFK